MPILTMKSQTDHENNVFPPSNIKCYFCMWPLFNFICSFKEWMIEKEQNTKELFDK